jgi:enoyl-CoA hydratase/carnithine racemase
VGSVRRMTPTGFEDLRYEDLRYEVEGPVARLTIDRESRRNALSWALVAELRRALAAAKADPAVRVVVLTGAGERAFCAGADLTGMSDGASFAELHEGRGGLADLFRDLYALGKPTIARVRGYALAGGFGLALACDLVVAADDAEFGTPEIDLGLWPHMITVPLLRSMPPKRVLELMLTGRRLDAEAADRLGFLTAVVPVAELDATVDALAATLAAKPPDTVRQGRDSFYAVWDRSVEDSLRLLHPLLTITASSGDAAEGIAAFTEKRPPRWAEPSP